MFSPPGSRRTKTDLTFPADGKLPDETSMRRDEWIRFAESVSESAPMDHPSVWLSWLEAHPHFVPAIFERRDGHGRLVALLPLYRKGGELRVATDQHLDYQSITARTVDDAAELLREVVGFCLKQGLVLTLARVAHGSLLHRALQHPRLLKVAWTLNRYLTICPIGHYRWEEKADLISALPRSRRRDYRTSVRRLAEAFPDLVVAHLVSGEIEPGLVDEIASLHLQGPHGGEGQSVFRVPGFIDFLKRLGRRESGLVLSVARDRPGGDLLAFILGFRHRETFLYYLTSFRQAEKDLSPGNWLLVESLKRHEETVNGREVFLDLLSGREPYKKRWTKTAYEVDRYRVLPRRAGMVSRLIAISTVYRLKSLKNRLLGLGGGDDW